ncbi:MAG: hypothetical protein MJZ49_03605 [Bacteroidales bacterium]|nr:hypothetical protein [Bacteroidales bacterium]
MTFEQFHAIFSPLGCVSSADMREQPFRFDKNSLTRWCENGYLVKLRNGLYAFPEYLENADFRYFAASKMYVGSYVSLHTALMFHGFISSQPAGQVSCVSHLKTAEFRNLLGDFDFHCMKRELVFGFEMMEETAFPFPMATPEKALLDLFYLFPQYYDSEQSLRNFALEEKRLFEEWNSQRMYDFLEFFRNSALERRISLFVWMFGL